MLDEPFAGIDPVTVQNIQRIICRLRDKEIAILITDHAVREILQIVDRAYVIKEGTVICSGTPNEIRTNSLVIDTYLGDMEEDESSQAGAA